MVFIEVDEETHPETAEFQMCLKLSFVNFGQLLDGLQLDDNRMFDEKVGSVPNFDANLFIDHGDGNLNAYMKPALP
jgi:hypothetical protein